MFNYTISFSQRLLLMILHSPLAQGQETKRPVELPDKLVNVIFYALLSLIKMPAYYELLNIYDVNLQSSIVVTAYA